MKNLFLVSLILAVFGFSACGQKANVPAKVKTAFSQKFPQATNVNWDKESATEWEAEFKMDGNKYSANFDQDGHWKETEYLIHKSELPATVKTTLKNKFAGYDVEKAEVSETPAGKVFEMKIENDETDMEVAINANGKVVKKEVKKDNDKEGDEEKEEEHEGNR